ncbi:MAG: glycosyltransferase family 2 protein [Maricaulaceae bacterium]
MAKNETLLKKPHLALIVPAYNESKGLIGFNEAVSDIMKNLSCTYKIVFIDDGSVDDTWETALTLSKQDRFVSAISFSRNFGKEYAILAGLNETEADYYLVMDADMQHPPTVIPHLWERMLKGDVDVVEGVKTDRGRESALYRACSNLFYRVLYILTKQNLKNSSDFKLFTQNFRNAILSLDDGAFFFRGACQWVGFPKATVDFIVAERLEGESKFSIKALLRLMNNAILSNTKTLLRLSIFIGIIFGLFSITLGLNAVYNKVTEQATSGFTTVILFLSIQACFTFLSLGIIGEYLARIYYEVKKYPSYIIGRQTNDQ